MTQTTKRPKMIRLKAWCWMNVTDDGLVYEGGEGRFYLTKAEAVAAGAMGTCYKDCPVHKIVRIEITYILPK